MQHQYGARGLKVAIIDVSELVTGKPPNKGDLINASYDWHLDIPLLEDVDKHVASKSRINQVPSLVLLACDGVIVQRWNGLTRPAVLAQSIEKLCVADSRRSRGE